MRTKIKTMGIALMMTAVMLLGEGFGIPGAAAEGIDNRKVLSVTEHQGKLYVAYDVGELVTLNPATQEEQTIGHFEQPLYVDMEMENQTAVEQGTAEMICYINQLFSDGQMLYGLSTDSGLYYTLLNEQEEYAPVRMPTKLDDSVFTIDRGGLTQLSVTQMFAMNGNLYYGTMLTGDTNSFAMGYISLHTGEATPMPAENVFAFAPWKDGQLVCLTRGKTQTWWDGKTTMQYGFMDLETGIIAAMQELPTEGRLGSYGIGAVASDPSLDMLYYVDDSVVYGIHVPDGQRQALAYTGTSSYSSFALPQQHAVVNGYTIRNEWGRLYTNRIDSEIAQDHILHIYSLSETVPHKRFLQKHPDIPVRISTPQDVTLDRLISMLVSDSNPFDVLLLDTGRDPVKALIAKGYAMDISGNAAIMKEANRLYPALTMPLRKDDQLCALPTGFDCNILNINMDNWEALGLTEEEVPSTWLELLAFIAQRVEIEMENPSSIRLFRPFWEDIHNAFLRRITNAYIAHTQANGHEIDFESPAYTSLLEQLEQIDFDALQVLTEGEATYSNFEDKFLMSFESVISEFEMLNDSYRPIALQLAEDTPAALYTSETVLIINPSTKNKELALQYAAFYMQNLDETKEAIVMRTDHDLPVDHMFYAMEKEALLKSRKELEDKLAVADEIHQAELREDIARTHVYEGQLEETRYSISPVKIAKYRERIAPYLWVNVDSGLDLYTSGLSKLLEQYQQGALPAKQMTAEMNRIVRMMQLEAQ